jgi:hypothetical protein
MLSLANLRFLTTLGMPLAPIVLLGCGPSLQSLSAGRVGCAPADVRIADERSDMASKSWTATCNGVEYQCVANSIPTGGTVVTSKGGVGSYSGTTLDVACTPLASASSRPVAPSAPPPMPSPPLPAAPAAPTGAAGFSFGAAEEDSARLCTTAGQTWDAADANNIARCSGPAAPVGMEARTELRFCDGVVCRIDVLHRPATDDSDAWVRRFGSLRDALEKKYGVATKSRDDFPAGCASALLSCLQDGRAALGFAWSWTTGHAVTLEMGKLAGTPVIRISYALRKAPAL